MFSRMMFAVALGALVLLSGSHTSAQGRGTPPGAAAGGADERAVSAADRPHRGGHHGHTSRIRVAARHRRHRGADDDPRRRAGVEAAVRQ